MEKWLVEGLMPERAIDRLQKGGICVFSVKKIEKKQILFCINKKDLEKAFAIYPNMCYNSSCGSVYSFTRVGALDARARKIAMQRLIAVCLGVCCFFLLVGGFSPFVLRIKTVGADVYKRETLEILKENGITLYSPYPSGKENAVCSKILALDGVEFCSLQKRGNTVIVEIRTNVFSSARQSEGDLISPCDGVVESAVTLGGTLLKKSGEKVLVGEKLVGAYFVNGEGENGSVTKTAVVAKVKLVCEKTFERESIQDGVAEARLYVESLGGTIIEIVTDGTSATARYSVTVKKNM
ncbi:MAG: hypothetical protein E7343_03255 [Clostridiales bacterium]|nr:hypothetical protein [Clostridiales bacterium]